MRTNINYCKSIDNMYDCEYSIGDSIQLKDYGTGMSFDGYVVCFCDDGGLLIETAYSRVTGAMTYDEAIAEFPELEDSVDLDENSFYVYVDDSVLADTEYED